ncbi:hypothetical protein Tco_1163309 [Tanacetum coccineum]
MGNEDIKPPMDGDNLVPIPRVFEKPLNPILETSNTTITVPLFDFDSEFSLNSDNPILDIQNKESDEFKTETIMEKSMKMECLIPELELFIHSHIFGDIPVVPSVPHGRINSGI